MGWASEALFNDIHRAAIKSGMYLTGGLSYSEGVETSDTSKNFTSDDEIVKEVKEEVKKKIKDETQLDGVFTLNGLVTVPELELFKIEEKEEKIEQNVVGYEIMFNVTSKQVFGNNKHEKHLGVFNVNLGGLVEIFDVNLWLDKNTGEYSITMPSKQTTKQKYFSLVNIHSEELKLAILESCLETYRNK